MTAVTVSLRTLWHLPTIETRQEAAFHPTQNFAKSGDFQMQNITLENVRDVALRVGLAFVMVPVVSGALVTAVFASMG